MIGKPRGRYARVAFELVLRNLGLITSCPGWPPRARTTSPQFRVCPMDSDIQCGPLNAFTGRDPASPPMTRTSRTGASDVPTSQPPMPGTD
jgi:hypothetical protein